MVRRLKALGRHCQHLLLLSLTLNATPGLSQQSLLEEDITQALDEEFVSIATGTAQPLSRAPSVATVITAKDIEAMGATDLDAILETVPGLHVSRSSNRLNAIYSLRGIHTQQNPQMLLLINGVEFGDAITGSRPPLFRLPVANISRIEVIRGPGSAIYGADAFAGVINVITRDAGGIDGTEAGLRAGSFETRDIWLQHGGSHKGWDIAFSLEYATSEGDDDRIIDSDLQTTFDLLFDTNASLTPGPLATQYNLLNTSLTLSRGKWNIWLHSWNLDNAGTGAGVANALDPTSEQQVDHYTLKIDYQNKKLTRNLTLDTHLVYRLFDQSVNFTLFPPGAKLPIGSDGNLLTPPGCSTTQPHPILGDVCLIEFTDGLIGNPGGELKDYMAEFVLTHSGYKNHLIRFAAGIDFQQFNPVETKNFGPGIIDGSVSPINGTLTSVTGTGNIFMPNESRTVHYLSLQDVWRLSPDWELTSGIRYDNYSDFGETINPRLALVGSINYNLTTKLLYGRAFRAPSFAEFYFENNPALRGNPNLDPETIDMLELAFDYRPYFNLQTVLNLYVYYINDLIEFDEQAQAQNAKDQRGHGSEIDINWYPSDTWRLQANMAWQHSEDADTGNKVPDAPGLQAMLGANWLFAPSWSLNAQISWVGDRKRAENDLRSNIDDYTNVDFTMRRQPTTSPWEWAASIRNAFDEDIREPSDANIPRDYPLERRRIYLEIKYHFDH